MALKSQKKIESRWSCLLLPDSRAASERLHPQPWEQMETRRSRAPSNPGTLGFPGRGYFLGLCVFLSGSVCLSDLKGDVWRRLWECRIHGGHAF